MIFEQPDFLNNEVFSWNALGYQLSKSPSLDLLSSVHLQSNNPWIILATTLQRAKNGDFSSLPLLIKCMRESDDWILSRDCALLLGDAGPSSLLRQVVKEIYAEEDIDISYSFHSSRLLWTVPLMLDIYFRMPNRQEAPIVPVLISELLENSYGVIAHGSSSETPYREMVMQKYNILYQKFGTDEIPICYGELFSVKKIALQLYNNLKAEDVDTLLVRELRHRFEAATGINCSTFFQEKRLQPLTAIAIVEDFIESHDINKYEEGVRYFFSHRIPD